MIARPKDKDKPKEAKKPKGRPTLYSNELINKICELIMSGKSMVEITKMEDMPGQTQVYKWLNEHKDFAEKYTRAREIQADVYFDQIIEIADCTTEDDIFNEQGNRVANSEWINRSRLRVDARKWAASKLAPKKYGDKIEVDNKGEVGLTVSIINYSDKDK